MMVVLKRSIYDRKWYNGARLQLNVNLYTNDSYSRLENTFTSGHDCTILMLTFFFNFVIDVVDVDRVIWSDIHDDD